MSDFTCFFVDGTPITKINVPIAELGVTEIRFIERGLNHFRSEFLWK